MMTDKSPCCGAEIDSYVEVFTYRSAGLSKVRREEYCECSKCHRPVEGKEGG